MKISPEALKTQIKELQNALEKIVQSKEHKEAIEIAGAALNWPESAKKALANSQTENSKMARLLKEALRKAPPKPEHYGGWHLCDYCRKVVVNGQICGCRRDIWKDNQPPYKPAPIWCQASGAAPMTITGVWPSMISG